ncbi:response regulator transcription factor [Streptomyces silvisoli]|uniref:Response regulator transcription factor n=1 Tax=Streptomyces silvisoli TaxID=3034235 RepID=A0ABT5ZPJ2_9ACTN|nr:response regulator transcription factor [Streptomyces silvisoli]MDF3291576.1 response regulator transcription factor [Streptomyces silvisoli]
MRVLLIEDDDTIAEPLAEGLGRYGFAVDRVGTGAAALDVACPDMVLLDLGLPDMDGIDVCRALRSRSDVPIIMITARGDETDRVVGLELGADDYLSKPFGLRELVARIRAVTRRTHIATAPYREDDEPTSDKASQHLGDVVINRRTRQVYAGSQQIALAPKEFDLLALLAEDPGAVYSRQHILDKVWDPHFFGPTKTLDVHIAALRRKLDRPAWIETVRGVGFRLAVPTDPSRPTGTSQATQQ